MTALVLPLDDTCANVPLRLEADVYWVVAVRKRIAHRHQGSLIILAGLRFSR